MGMKRNRQNLAIFRAFNCEDSDGWDEGIGARIKGEAQLCGLSAWVVGNPKSPGGEAGFEMFDFEHALQKMSSQQLDMRVGR